MSSTISEKKQRESKAFPKNNEVFTHSTSLDFMGMLEWLPNPDAILNELGLNNQKAYENIVTDSHLTGVMQQREAAVSNHLWEIDRGQDQKKHTEFITEVFESLDIYGIMENALEAPYYGFIPMEVVWNKPKNGAILPAAVIGKPPEWFQFNQDNELRWVNREAPAVGVPVKHRKVILARHKATYKNPYGLALLSRVFWPVTFKKAGWKFFVAFAEKFGSPIVWGKVPRPNDETEFAKLAADLGNLIQDSVVITPEDSQVELIETKGSGQSSPHERLVKMANNEISKAILSQTMTTEQGENGARSLGEVHKTVADDIILKDKRMVEDMFNTLIRWILEINFGSSKDAPNFCLYKEEAVDLDQATRDKTLTDTGQVRFTKKYWMESYGLAEDEIDVIEPTDPESEPGNKKPEEEDDKNDFSEMEFAESIFKDQRAVDFLVDSFGPDDLQEQSKFVKPINDLGQIAESFEEFSAGLIKIFPDVRPEEMELKLRNALFAVQVFGNLTGSET